MITKEELLSKTPLFEYDFESAQNVFEQFKITGVWEQWNRETQDYETIVDAEQVARLKDYTILYARYTYEDYAGDASVVGYDAREEKFFEVVGSHCSCYGLEDQWDMEYFDSVEQMLEVLGKRRDHSWSHFTVKNMRAHFELPELENLADDD